jgi:uncharacterized phage protein (TIGR02220 family)
MSRPRKAVVDYFPHYVNHGKTMFTLENRYGNDGYAFWFKTLELLGSSENHYIDCNNPIQWEFMLAKTRLNEETATEILNLLAKIDAIDTDLWSKKIIRSKNFIDNLSTVYARREVSVVGKSHLMGLMSVKTPLSEQDVNINPQSKVKESKVKESIKKIYCRVVTYLNEKTGKNFKHTSQKTQSLINARLSEHFTEADFITVIDNKVAQWLNDAKMAEFLRPETLFGTKFESYLNGGGKNGGSCSINQKKDGANQTTDFSEYDKGTKVFDV